ncbi:MAG TPA: AAA family ATPase [Pseudobdellovibrionaceae bacterium]
MAIETIAIYQDFNGNDIQKVIRKDNPGGKKSFSQWSLENESWIPKAPKGEVAPLFYREWKDKPNVILGEGEKVAQRLKELGLNATATPGGAGAWKKHYAKAFAGKVVSILPDNDEAGRKYASHAFRDIKEVAKSTRIVDLPGLKGKEDVVDWLDAGGTKEQLLAIIAEAFDVESHDVLASRERLKTKLICLNDVQSTQVEFLVEPYFPIGKVSLMSGDPGVGKSTFVAMLASAISAGRSISLAGSDNEKG